jgi:hypothetical protein
MLYAVMPPWKNEEASVAEASAAWSKPAVTLSATAIVWLSFFSRSEIVLINSLSNIFIDLVQHSKLYASLQFGKEIAYYHKKEYDTGLNCKPTKQKKYLSLKTKLICAYC